MGESKITLESIYTGFWKCRDLEIQMLWTRLTLLGAFMALTYTGYGVLLMKIIENKPLDWNIFNLLAVGMGCFGMLFSTLWVLMAKGSKAWYEQYEAAIGLFQKGNEDVFERSATGDLILSYLDFKDSKIQNEREPIDSSLFTQKAGRFSVSKIPIVMGQVSLIGWGCVVFGHFWCLFAGKEYMRLMVDNLGIKITCVAVMATCFAIATICHKSRSGSL